MNEPVVVCPNCREEIKLTESLAAPLVEATRKQYEAKLARQESEIGKREVAIREAQLAVALAKRASLRRISRWHALTHREFSRHCALRLRKTRRVNLARSTPANFI